MSSGRVEIPPVVSQYLQHILVSFCHTIPHEGRDVSRVRRHRQLPLTALLVAEKRCDGGCKGDRRMIESSFLFAVVLLQKPSLC